MAGSGLAWEESATSSNCCTALGTTRQVTLLEKTREEGLSLGHRAGQASLAAGPLLGSLQELVLGPRPYRAHILKQGGQSVWTTSLISGSLSDPSIGCSYSGHIGTELIPAQRRQRHLVCWRRPTWSA